MPVLPLTGLRDLLSGDEESLREVLERVVDSLTEVRAGVVAAVASYDKAELVFLAHRFKSVAGQLEATTCHQLCERLNHVARQEGPTVRREVEELVAQVVPALDALERDINETLTSLSG